MVRRLFRFGLVTPPSPVPGTGVDLASRQRPPPLPGSLQGPRELHSRVLVCDLSAGGAVIAHTVELSPGDPCVLWLHLEGRELSLPARVMWAVPTPGADAAGPPFRSGLQFHDLPSGAKAHLTKYLSAPPDRRPSNPVT